MDESMQREGYVIGSFFIRAYLLYKSKHRTGWVHTVRREGGGGKGLGSNTHLAGSF